MVDHSSSIPGDRAVQGRGTRWVQVALGLALLLLLAVAVQVVRQGRLAADTADWAAHTHAVLDRAGELDVAVSQMEAKHRGFLIAGDPAQLQVRDELAGRAATVLEQLRELTREDPEQQQRLETASRLIAARREGMLEESTLAAQAGPQVARARFREEDAGAFEAVRAELADLRRHQEALLRQRAAEALAHAATLRRDLAIAGALALLLLLAAGTALLRQQRAREAGRAELARAHALQGALFDAAGYMIIGTRADGAISHVNRTAQQRLGYPADELVGRATPAVLHDPSELAAQAQRLSDEFGEPVPSGIETLLARSRRGLPDENRWTWVRRDGSRFPVQLVVAPVRDGAGELVGFVGVARDIGDLVAAEEQNRALTQSLELQAAQLLAANRELESFSYSVSHDLRAPLRHINGYAQMLEEDAADVLTAEPRRYLAAIKLSARRMGTLVDDLLSLSRLGRKPLVRERVDMRALVTAALAELGGGDGRVEVGALPDAIGDGALLRQVWINLLSNALKYSAPRGDEARVLVSGTEEDGAVRYAVADNGVGFDPQYAGKLFAVFQRLHGDDAFEGTGVGLAIVHRIVTRHGGEVSATGAPGIGATFGFRLPQFEAPHQGEVET